MTGHTILFLTAVLIFVACLLAAYTVYLRRARSVSRGDDLAALLAKLTALDGHKLAQVAAGLERPGESDEEEILDSWQVWELTGGLPGIEAMASNCNILIELASHVQEWYPEALTVAEELRLNAREIHWHLERLRSAEQHGHNRSAYPEYAQQAATAYVRMTRNVLHLYEAAAMPGLQQLQAVL